MRLLVRSVSVAALLAVPFPLLGQRIGFSAGGSVIAAKLESRSATVTERLSGALLGGEGRITSNRLTLDVRYLQGSANPVATGRAKDVVEGEALLGVRLARWITLKTGPHLRTLVSPQQSERWTFWDVRVRGMATIASGILQSYVELGGAVAGSVNTGEKFGRGSGVEAVLIITPPKGRVWGRLGYRMDRGSVDDGTRLETVQGLVLSLGVGQR